MKETKMPVLLRNFVIELIVYGTLVITYSVVVLRLLTEPLSRFFNNNLIVYALVSLLLIVAQGVLLDAITSFLIDQLRLEQLE